MDDQEDSDLDGQDEVRPKWAPLFGGVSTTTMPERGTPEYRALVSKWVEDSVHMWGVWRAMLTHERPRQQDMTDERLEQLMWQHAGLALESLATLAELDQAPAGSHDRGPHLSDLLAFVGGAVRQTLQDGRSPRFFRTKAGARKGGMERNCIVFAEAYEAMAAETTPDRERLLPDDDPVGTICEFYALEADAYRKAKQSLRSDDYSPGYRWHPGAFRYRLTTLPPGERLAYARNQIRQAGHDCQSLSADREIHRPRRAAPAPKETCGSVKPSRRRKVRGK